MLWNGLLWLHKSGKTGLFKAFCFSFPVLQKMITASPGWGRAKPGDGMAVVSHGAPGHTWAMMGTSTGSHGSLCPMAGVQPACRPAANLQGWIFPAQPSQGSQDAGAPCHTNAPKITQHVLLCVETKRREKKKKGWRTLLKASYSYAHGVVQCFRLYTTSQWHLPLCDCFLFSWFSKQR